MFSTTVGFSLDIHLCGGQIKSFSLHGQAKSCHEIGDQVKVCSLHAALADNKQASVIKKSCCQNKSFEVLYDQDLQNVTTNFSVSSKVGEFIQDFFPIHRDKASLQIVLEKSFQLYKPPPLIRDVPLQVQSFLL